MKKPNTFPGPHRWYHFISPLSMLLSFFFSSLTLLLILWFRLFRSRLTVEFSSMNPYFLAILSLTFLLLSLSFLHFSGFLWEPRKKFLPFLISRKWLIPLYSFYQFLSHLLLRGHGFVFMFLLENFFPREGIMLFPLARGVHLLAQHFSYLSFPLSCVLFSWLPRFILCAFFLVECLRCHHFHYFYALVPLFLLPWLYKKWLSFWEIWAYNVAQYIEMNYLEVREGGEELFFFTPLFPMRDERKDLWIQRWILSCHCQSWVLLCERFSLFWEPRINLFLFFSYFLGWSSILLRFFFL